jgi:hypothetical protein
MKFAFDIGGVISKYPDVFYELMLALLVAGHEVHVITDMHDKVHSLDMLSKNGFSFIPSRMVHNANYTEHGELCKAVLLKELEIDMFFDDFPGYLTEGCPVRCQVLPDPRRPYYAPSWKTDGSEGNFGRRTPK